jgi:hypothetical protein
MYIILEEHNVIGVSNDKYPDTYVKDILDTYISSDKLCPRRKDVNDITYDIVTEDNVYTLSKNELFYIRGYLSNTLKSKQTKLSTITVLEYNAIPDKKSIFESKLIEKLNTRILTNMDKDSLLQFILKFNSNESAYKISEMLSIHKKTLYSSIAHKLNRFGS